VPEGHTIHRLARDLNSSFEDSKVRASSPQGRFEAGAAKIDGQTCKGFEAFGKHLVGHFAAGDVLHVHLGLIGKFRKAKGDPVGAVRLRLASDEVNWDLRGPMVCDLGSPDLADKVADSVGPDPLRAYAASNSDAEAQATAFIEAMKRRRIAVGAALLDQKVIAGIGNVYRAELLFILGIDPLTPANALDDSELRMLWDLSTEQLRQGEKLNRIVTVDPALGGHKTARSIPRGGRLYAYKRADKPCLVCDTPIELLEVAGRKMWRCPNCQPTAVTKKKTATKKTATKKAATKKAATKKAATKKAATKKTAAKKTAAKKTAAKKTATKKTATKKKKTTTTKKGV